MSKINKGRVSNYEKEFIQIFRDLSYTRSTWEVWQDLMTIIACAISNSTDREPERFMAREHEYNNAIKRLGGSEKPLQIYSNIVEALQHNPDQDYLGELYMQLELYSHWKGQLFTPYHVSRAMAEMSLGDCPELIKQKGWISVCDPTIGGGSMILAAVSTLKRQKVYFHDHVLFVGQDIDRVVSMMAYIQMSLLACPGYIIVADSLANPMIGGSALFPSQQEGQEFWFTPFFFAEVWDMRRRISIMKRFLSSNNVVKNNTEPIFEGVVAQIPYTSKKKTRSCEGQVSIFDMIFK